MEQGWIHDTILEGGFGQTHRALRRVQHKRPGTDPADHLRAEALEERRRGLLVGEVALQEGDHDVVLLQLGGPQVVPGGPPKPEIIGSREASNPHRAHVWCALLGWGWRAGTRQRLVANSAKWYTQIVRRQGKADMPINPPPK